MVFSSSIFLFLFLPFALIGHLLLPVRLKNFFLLLVSLLFYSWGEHFYALLMVFSILVNYSVGLWIDRQKSMSNPRISPLNILLFGIFLNLTLLIYFKYANFLCGGINKGLGLFSFNPIPNSPIHLPIGISFFTFQAMSYLIDIYRKTTTAQKNFVDCALYISLFPQMIAGPIVRYSHIAVQLSSRSITVEKFSSGVQRFIYGLAKKMLIANPLGALADSIFALPSSELGILTAWLGITAYSLQIFFDFSGYSDMAIGLGRMFGFDFLENFNYPYISKSLKEFWRRWHISLSTWFRDYVYLPLGGNRLSPIRTYINLWTVFILCGLWHGASWNFLVWGCFHGSFLVFERIGLSKMLSKLWSPVQHLYTLFIVAIAWVFFRSETLPSALEYISALLGFRASSDVNILQHCSPFNLIILTSAIILSTPVVETISKLAKENTKVSSSQFLIRVFQTGYFLQITILLIVSLSFVASGTYNPFIYFRF